MKRVPLVLSLMVITGLILAACGGTPAPQLGKESVELVFWHTQSGSNQKALDEMISTFNATNNKKITMKSEYQGNYTQLYQKVLAAIQAKTPPDLSVGYESQVADYMKANAVIPLDDKIKALDKKIYDDVFPIFWEMAKFPQFKNQTLLAPFTKSVAGIYYNEDALREAGVRVPTIQQPWTWE
jgi:ABC-type glycerol-3-phosphate transport system substrate-binding protein